ncbi:VanZ family protein [Zhihengliuella halotolerans]|uniref:Glycopeptide antibiotics resistance protein n=1 Tax=Zhihengliuella halotolerans TaxID=370736 RepID=A0A4Q8AFE8_9MICC|nr:VanZ family protein [Zhihengliuella halotolerans]RZU63042.1 glycopeptide antibiotics resistance protein [Zhihengliuella halotolerans]
MTNLLRSFGHLLPIFLILAAVLAVGVFLAYVPTLRARRRVGHRMLWLWATLCWVSGVLLVTLFPQAWGMETSRTVSLTPFASFAGGAGVDGSVLMEAAANCLMFSVGGFLLGLATDRIGVIAAACVGLAVIVEFCQYVLALGRVASIDDVLWAGAGCLLGVAIARLSSRYGQNFRFNRRQPEGLDRRTTHVVRRDRPARR